MAHDFLSDSWYDAVEALRDEAPPIPPEAQHLCIDLVVETPTGTTHHAHFRAGQVSRGLASAETTIRVPFQVAKRLLVNGDPAAAMEAFLAGEITIDGDATALLGLQGAIADPTPEHFRFQRKIQKLTR